MCVCVNVAQMQTFTDIRQTRQKERKTDRRFTHFTVTDPLSPRAQTALSARAHYRVTLSTSQHNDEDELKDFIKFILTVSVDFREFSARMSVSRPLADPPYALH